MSNDYNPDELEALEWLNEQYIWQILSKYENTIELKLIEFEISPASAQGDHYASVMFRIRVEYSTCKGHFTKSLILKTLPEKGKKKSMVNESHVFETEIAMYTKVLPMFETILRDADDDTVLCIPCIYYTMEPRQVMVFEDLVPQGYTVIRDRPASMKELKSALEKLAKWHSVSHKLVETQPELFDQLRYDLSTLPNFLNQSFLTHALPNFIYMLAEVEGLQKYKKYFEPLRGNLIQKWTDLLGEYRKGPQENSFYVLCHGDFHLRNVMYNQEDCILLDFQLSHVGPMVNDFLYAMYMFFGPEERGEHRDELIRYYLGIFADTSNKIGYQGAVPTFEDFQRQLIDKRHYGKN